MVGNRKKIAEARALLGKFRHIKSDVTLKIDTKIRMLQRLIKKLESGK